MDIFCLNWLAGDCVNNIVKLHYRRRTQQISRDNSSLTFLLCGEMGLVVCLEQAFLIGFKSARLFGKNFYLWDYFGELLNSLFAVNAVLGKTFPRIALSLSLSLTSSCQGAIF